MTLGSRFGFLRRGLITAILRGDGTCPIDKDEFIMFSKVLPITGNNYFTSLVGIGSNRHVEGFEDEINAVNSSSSIGAKKSSCSV